MMLLLLLLAVQWFQAMRFQAMMLFLFVLPGSLVALSSDAPLLCDFCHAPFFSLLVGPSHDVPLAHAC